MTWLDVWFMARLMAGCTACKTTQAGLIACPRCARLYAAVEEQRKRRK